MKTTKPTIAEVLGDCKCGIRDWILIHVDWNGPRTFQCKQCKEIRALEGPKQHPPK
jgi:hypothetical protein